MPSACLPPRSWLIAGAYLGCFGLGTFVAMALFTALVGELSSQMGATLGGAAAPAMFAMAASISALALGSVWTGRALFLLLGARRLVLA